jgi:peptide/nickel transport system substrate-binding protein
VKFRLLVFLSVCLIDCRLTPPSQLHSIRIGIESEPVTMDPHAHNDGATWTVLANIYEGLVAFDAELRIVPALAVKWENPDLTTWRFVLRKSVRFHNGHKMTASDVVYSLRRALNDPESQLHSKLAGVKDVRARGADVVDLETEFPDPVLLNKLASIYIVPRDSAGRGFQKSMGTGPYELVSWKMGAGVHLERFPQYWNNAPSIEDVFFVPLPERSLRVGALLRGRVDLLRGLSKDNLAEMRKNPKARLIIATGTTVSYLGFRFGGKDNPFDDPRLRQAIYLGIDVNRSDIFQGSQDVPNQPVPPSVFGYDPLLPARHRDINLARKLIDEMHQAKTKFTLEMPENSRQQFGPWLQQDLHEIGLEVEIVSHPWTEFYKRLIERKPSFYLIAWSCSSGDASEFLDSCIHSPAGGFGDCNVGKYSNPALDAMIEKSKSVMVNKDRRALLQQVMRRIMTDFPIVPIDYLDEYYGAGRNIEWTPRADGRILAREVRLSNQ